MRLGTKALTAAAVTAFLYCGTADAANYVFTFTNGSSTFASGAISTSNTANADGTFNITSVSGTIDGQAITGLYTGSQTAFTFYNALFTSSSDPLLGLEGI